MIPIQIALSILLVLLVAAYVFELLTARHDRKHERAEEEITELEAQLNVHPAGNVVLLKPAAEAEAMPPDKETEGSS